MSQPTSSKSEKKAPSRGITGISVCGYKSLYEECSIEIRPLTILAGANSSGKSSIMQPLLLMKQTLEATYDPGALLLNGPNVRFTSVGQLLSNLPPDKCSDRVTITLALEEQFLKWVFGREPTKGIDIIQMIYNEPEKEITFDNLISQDNLKEMIPEATANYFQKMFNKEIWENREVRVVRERCFLSFEIQYRGKIIFNLATTEKFKLEIRKLIHVPGLRGNPERNYKTTAIDSEFTGTFEAYVASVVNHWKRTKDERLKNLGSNLEILGLTWKVDAKQLDDTQFELLVGRLPRSSRGGETDLISIADVGFGVSQIIPVLVALLVAEAGQLVYLEQPEIHLHPRAQVALAQVLADAANRGVRVVLETHSALLLLAIQSLVAEEKISPDNVKLHWFKRRDDGVTEVSTAEFDESGAFGEWPEDFSEVDLKLQSRYLDAAEPKQRNC